MKRTLRDVSLRGIATLPALCAVAALLVASVRARLFEVHKRVKNRDDVYFLPPPEQVVTMSLGWRYALADLLWSHVMVQQGLHTFERRRYQNLTLLYDAINALDPSWRTPYIYADALITFQGATTPYDEIVKIREILERGVSAIPFDAEIWLNLGQFVSFVAPPSYLEDRPEVAERWRREGVAALQRAAELSGSQSWIAWQALGGAVILEKAGDPKAALAFLERLFVITDDEELRDDLRRRIHRLTSLRDERIDELESELRDLDARIATLDRKLRVTDDDDQKAAIKAEIAPLARVRAERDAEMKARMHGELTTTTRYQDFQRLYRRDLPFLAEHNALVLGPPLEPAECAGPDHAAARCATTWRDWAERYENEHPEE
jgi:tetratricopeptide (TPR) repeat protein